MGRGGQQARVVRHRGVLVPAGGHVRDDVGADVVDVHGRDLPFQGTGDGREREHGVQLAVEHGARVRGAAAAVGRRLEDVHALRRLQRRRLRPRVPVRPRDQGRRARGDGRRLRLGRPRLEASRDDDDDDDEEGRQ